MAANLDDLRDPLSHEIKLLDFNDARKALSYVNRGRLQLAERLRNITLWPKTTANKTWRCQARANDPPLVQLVFRLRDEINDALKHDDHSTNALKARGVLYAQLGSILSLLGKEAAQASSELAMMLANHEDLEQRKIEHEDKMEILRKRINGETDATPAELAHAAGIEIPRVQGYGVQEAPAPSAVEPAPAADPEPVVVERRLAPEEEKQIQSEDEEAPIVVVDDAP